MKRTKNKISAMEFGLRGMGIALLGVWIVLAWGQGVLAAEARVRIHYFWAPNCPHCAEARPVLVALAGRDPRIELVEHDVWGDRAAFNELLAQAEARGQMVSTPAILLGERLWFGFSPVLGREIEIALERCLTVGCADPLAPVTESGSGPEKVADLPADESVDVPVLGRVGVDSLSLPVLTAVIGLLDGFNPCAFFVLLFLLSLLGHARSRKLMLLVGGTFVFCSGLLYFLFMAAWLNLFLVAGALRGITLAAGLLAIVIAAINIKDFYFFKAGVSLSIPERAKPGLFARMRALVKTSKLPSVLVGTLVLALTANAYELLCTAGFPMIYTRILTLHQLQPWQHYLFLGFYCLIYVLPLLTIVLIFTWTLGSKKLGERQGRILKLLSGVMMLLLGGLLLSAPELLTNPLAALALLVLAPVAVALLVWLDGRFRPRHRCDR